MDAPSQLESFLNTHRADGRLLSGDGSFTLARDKALLKLADFQLPYEGAWAVKVVQCAVCVENQSEIRVQQTVRETRFGFDCPPSWTLDVLEGAFFTPESGDERSMNHLMSALWTVGVGKKRGFLLTLPERTEALLWDGAVMHRLPLQEPVGCSLTVSHRPSDHSLGNWLKDPGLSRRLNAEVARALSDLCYTCPVPLWLDGRRLDGFHLCPTHGWTGNSFPFYLSFLDGIDGGLRIGSGTYGNLKAADKEDALSPGLHVMSVRALGALRKRTSCGGVMMLSAHASKAVSRRYSKWETRIMPSICYWIRDGVVVEGNDIEVLDCACSVALFLGADDLQTDISGLALVDANKASRLVEGARRTKNELENVAEEAFTVIVSEAGKRGRVAGGAFLLLGTGLLFASPLHGFACMGAGIFTWSSSGKEERQLVATYREALKELTLNWPDRTSIRKMRVPLAKNS